MRATEAHLANNHPSTTSLNVNTLKGVQHPQRIVCNRCVHNFVKQIPRTSVTFNLKRFCFWYLLNFTQYRTTRQYDIPNPYEFLVCRLANWAPCRYDQKAPLGEQWLNLNWRGACAAPVGPLNACFYWASSACPQLPRADRFLIKCLSSIVLLLPPYYILPVQ